MQKDLDSLWAKKVDINGKLRWLPLPQHLLDTQFVIKMLYHHYLSDNQRSIIDQAIGDAGKAEKVVQLLGVTHDVGKATPAFQTKSSVPKSTELDKDIGRHLIQEKYWDQDASPLPYPKASPHALAGEVILNRAGLDDDITAIVGGHHGKTIDDYQTLTDQDGYPQNYYLDKRDTTFHQHWVHTQDELVKWCLAQSGFSDTQEVPAIEDISAQVILEGLVVMADWIASNTGYFPLFTFQRSRPDDLKQRLKDGWRRWFQRDQWTPRPLSDADTYYQERFGFRPRPLQRRLFRTIDRTERPGITIIESGMGTGKTEAALATVEQVAYKDGDRGMFFCLPTQGATNSMFKRIKVWADSISKQSGVHNDIHLVHGKAAMNHDYQSIPRSSHISNDEQDAQIMVNEWFTGNKRAILGNFVVGTIDQLLLMGLKKRHLALRHLGFSQKVVVIDEGHSFDPFMQQYLYRALDWLGQYHVPVIILSATLPEIKRTRMLKAYQDGKEPRLDAKKRTAYPLITYSDKGKVHQLSDFPKDDPMAITVHHLSDDELFDKVHELLKDGGIAGIVVNTVKRAQWIAKMFLRYYPHEVTLLHSSFIATTRSKKENKLLEMTGKHGKRPYRQIIIGTQVLQMSLDIDLDVLISDLAPMDMLIQRVGRMHRHRIHDKERPLALKHPHLYVLRTSPDAQFEPGASFIYGDYLLMRTQYFLPDVLRLPDSIAPLVQKVYDHAQLLSQQSDMDLPTNLQVPYERAKQRHFQKLETEQYRADDYRLAPYDDLEDDLIGWLATDVRDDAQGLAKVRDSNGSLEVIVVQRTADGQGYTYFGQRKTGKDLSKRIYSTRVAMELAQHTLRLPDQLFHDKNENSMERTIERLRAWDEQELPDWQGLPFLKGSLGIILDNNGQFELNGFILTYDDILGLRYERSDKNDESI